MAFGLAKTDNFMLGEASIMIGPQADLFTLGSAHSVGLCKNAKITQDIGTVDLTQGTQGSLVMSVQNSATLRVAAEVYEFTARTLAYGLAQDGSTIQTIASTTLSAAVTGGPSINTVTVTSAAGMAVGDFIMLSPPTSGDEDIPIRRITGISSNTLTLNAAVTTNHANGSTVTKFAAVKMADKSQQPPFLAAKVIGRLANNDVITILLPKVRITKGFDLSFGVQNFGNLPFEMQIFDLVATDPNFAVFGESSGLLLSESA